jgi:hypothetical protein
MRSIGRVGKCEASAMPFGAVTVPRVPHPDRFAVFPPHKGEGG